MWGRGFDKFQPGLVTGEILSCLLGWELSLSLKDLPKNFIWRSSFQMSPVASAVSGINCPLCSGGILREGIKVSQDPEDIQWPSDFNILSQNFQQCHSIRWNTIPKPDIVVLDEFLKNEFFHYQMYLAGLFAFSWFLIQRTIYFKNRKGKIFEIYSYWCY